MLKIWKFECKCSCETCSLIGRPFPSSVKHPAPAPSPWALITALTRQPARPFPALFVFHPPLYDIAPDLQTGGLLVLPNKAESELFSQIYLLLTLVPFWYETILKIVLGDGWSLHADGNVIVDLIINIEEKQFIRKSQMSHVRLSPSSNISRSTTLNTTLNDHDLSRAHYVIPVLLVLRPA